jgi:5-hydroxyisourate hydrolase
VSIERISTHLLDTGVGRPAGGVPVVLERIASDGSGARAGHGVTDDDGRVGALNPTTLEPGEYRLIFDTANYFASVHGQVFYPRITVDVRLPDGRPHFHIPVLASTFSYTTNLGS